jgi:hypothetical protein
MLRNRYCLDSLTVAACIGCGVCKQSIYAAIESLMPVTMTNEPTLTCDTKAAWFTWLAENHLASTGVWLRLAKRATGARR